VEVRKWHIADEVLIASKVCYEVGTSAATCLWECPDSAHLRPSRRRARMPAERRFRPSGNNREFFGFGLSKLSFSFGCSKRVGRPYADVIDALRARGLEEAGRREMHVDGIASSAATKCHDNLGEPP
jgi:hypothetical protein